ncbi:MAG: hypothetical protein R2706_14220 [Acidimicrobiales bacterium]
MTVVLTANSVVVTVMSNLGFRMAMDRLGITVVETKVGDRYVLEALNAGQLSLGGEQSGHVICRTSPRLATGCWLVSSWSVPSSVAASPSIP